MNNRLINATIEILGKYYPVRCTEAEVGSLQKAAKFLNGKMQEVQDTGKVLNLERIAIITALNIAHLYLDLSQQKSTFVSDIQKRIALLQEKIDLSLLKASQTELIYSTDD